MTSPFQATATDPPPKPSEVRKKKQALVLIHGIGEQVPMETLRGFVEAVWTTDATLRRPNVPATAWSKPDEASGNYELRRLTTAESKEGSRTDFFEFYWASLMHDSRLSHVIAWARVLVLRSPTRVPRQLRGIWLVLVSLVVLAGLAVVNHACEFVPIPPAVVKLGAALWLVVGGTVVWFLVRYAGDAARYLHVAPENINIRRSIREAGIQLLQRLHVSGKYDRIIVVGHSLGSVIGYDVLTHLWPRYYYGNADQQPALPQPALQELERLARESQTNPPDTKSYQKAQSACLAELQSQGNKWLVTDFVTLGSPLAHAPVLLARDEGEFRRKKEERELPTSPPVLEHVDGKGRFSYQHNNVWVPHHAAVFGPTRWTNLYFPCRWTLWGDVIGGPMAPLFGSGIRDVPVGTNILGGLLSHTAYWKLPKQPSAGSVATHIQALRAAVRIVEH